MSLPEPKLMYSMKEKLEEIVNVMIIVKFFLKLINLTFDKLIKWYAIKLLK